MTEFRTLRPGLLVSMSTSIKGNIAYRTLQLEAEHATESGEARARWETERVITNPAEHEAAVKLRSKVRSLIVGVCSASAFGLLVPEDKADELLGVIEQARALVDEFNESAELTRVSFHVIYGRIASDDEQAVKAISGEVRSLMDDMQDALARLDVKAIRDAANKAREVGEMLAPDAKARVEVAIEAARQAARKIVKAGESAAVEIDRAALARIDMARTSFLDLVDEDTADIAAPVMEGRALDFAV